MSHTNSRYKTEEIAPGQDTLGQVVVGEVLLLGLILTNILCNKQFRDVVFIVYLAFGTLKTEWTTGTPGKDCKPFLEDLMRGHFLLLSCQSKLSRLVKNATSLIDLIQILCPGMILSISFLPLCCTLLSDPDAKSEPFNTIFRTLNQL